MSVTSVVPEQVFESSVTAELCTAFSDATNVVPEQGFDASKLCSVDFETSVPAELCTVFPDAMSDVPEQDPEFVESSVIADLRTPSDAMSVAPEQDCEPSKLCPDAFETSVAAELRTVYSDATSVVDNAVSVPGSCAELAAASVFGKHATTSDENLVAKGLEGRCIRTLFRCMESFDLPGTYEICECMTEAGFSLNPGVMQCVLAWVQSACSLLKLLSDPSFDDFMNDIAVHRCCFPGSVNGHLGGPAPNLYFDTHTSCDDLLRIRACQRICCLAPGLFDSKCQQAIDECWQKDDFLDWWRMKLFDPFDDSVGLEFVESFMSKLWHEDSEGFMHDWPYWHFHHNTT
jgi:hypothetical protein